ncbi:family 20 glycosylhydrolase [Pendulispora brunnea]|uniref:Family 20 glycosylhydrolase n=1 Tax=Pendulispora brunnea TaxID=2905690 RepID=A0ABZ2KB42_9BACT
MKSDSNCAVLCGLFLLAGCSTHDPSDPSERTEPGESPPFPQAVVASPPPTIPALREWRSASGVAYTFTRRTRIVVHSEYASDLLDTAAVFAADLKSLSGFPIPIMAGGASDVREGDVFFELGSTDAELGTEGYTLTVGPSIAVRARTSDGVFYGTRTLLQWLSKKYTLDAGTARDWPRYPERGLMVDVGRKYFTVGWLRGHIRELAYLKMNYFHVHLSDNKGFRLESLKHPEIVSFDHYSKVEMAELLALAKAYHVAIIPEIDMPGHMDPILAAHPELKLKSSNGTVQNGFIDLSMERSYTLLEDLIEEYLPLFSSKYWHIGADEYVSNYADYPQLLTYARAKYGPNATARDVYYGFIHWANDIVRAAGKTTRMWNDGIASHGAPDTLKVDANIVVDYWTNSGLKPQQLIDTGHDVNNSSWTPTYYVLDGAKPDLTYGYERWTPNIFERENTVSPAEPHNLGSKVHVWCDNPNAETQEHIRDGIRPALRVLAQQTWGSPKPVSSYNGFQTLMDTVGSAPSGTDVKSDDLALGRPVTVSSTETPNFPGTRAVDGTHATRWSSEASDAQWMQIDLGSRKSVRKVILNWEAAYATSYELQISDDASSWTTIYATTKGRGLTETLSGLDAHARYLRLNLKKRGTRYGYSLYEVEVYGSFEE